MISKNHIFCATILCLFNIAHASQTTYTTEDEVFLFNEKAISYICANSKKGTVTQEKGPQKPHGECLWNRTRIDPSSTWPTYTLSMQGPSGKFYLSVNTAEASNKRLYLEYDGQPTSHSSHKWEFYPAITSPSLNDWPFGILSVRANDAEKTAFFLAYNLMSLPTHFQALQLMELETAQLTMEDLVVIFLLPSPPSIR